MPNTTNKELLDELSKLLNDIEQKIPNEGNISSHDIAKSLRVHCQKSSQEIIDQFTKQDDQIERENRTISNAVEAALFALETRENIESSLPLNALRSLVRTYYQVGAALKTEFEIKQTKKEKSDAGRASVNAKHAKNKLAKIHAVELLSHSSQKKNGWPSIIKAAKAIEHEFIRYILDKRLDLDPDAAQDTLRKWMGPGGDPEVRKAFIDNASDDARKRLK